MDAARTIALLGANGAGGPSLLRLLATAIRPSCGRGAAEGLDLDRDAALVRERVAYRSRATGLYDDLGRPSLVRLDEPYAALDADGMAIVDPLLAA